MRLGISDLGHRVTTGEVNVRIEEFTTGPK